jgi:hypothetical protein
MRYPKYIVSLFRVPALDQGKVIEREIGALQMSVEFAVGGADRGDLAFKSLLQCVPVLS